MKILRVINDNINNNDITKGFKKKNVVFHTHYYTPLLLLILIVLVSNKSYLVI